MLPAIHLGVIVLFLALGVLFSLGKGAMLIAGYNTCRLYTSRASPCVPAETRAVSSSYIVSSSTYWVSSVSYTHLDVYKRQVQCGLFPVLQYQNFASAF